MRGSTVAPCLLAAAALAAAPPASTGELVFVPGGTFQMGDTFGDTAGNRDETPVHEVTLDGFYLGRTDVTFDEYDRFCDATGRSRTGDSGWGRGRRPVIHVSWYDAVEYCNWRSEQEGLTPFYRILARGFSATGVTYVDHWKVVEDWSSTGYRLPTEAEWEYAAREGGKPVRFGTGKDVIGSDEANFDAARDCRAAFRRPGIRRGMTTPVASFPPNALGLHDMAGNAFQWVNDRYDSAYYATTPRSSPRGSAGGGYFAGADGEYPVRVVRGGSFGSSARDVRASAREWLDPIWDHNPSFVRTFRVARSAR